MSCDYILQLHCPDRKGILAEVTAAVARTEGDVRDAASFGDDSTGEFFIRMHLRFPTARSATLAMVEIRRLSDTFRIIGWAMRDCSMRPVLMLMVSKLDHCLVDLLHSWKRGSLAAEIPLVVSNHETLREVVESHGVQFHYLPVNKRNRRSQEKKVLALVEEHQVDLVVLARYMQILSPETCDALAGLCINIHHSFLPSFKGASPYRQAYDRGVKLIGATAHYVTESLDDGPIIEQEVRRVNHATSASEMAAIGRETESSVLARAVRWHLEHRILLDGSKTVVFT